MGPGGAARRALIELRMRIIATPLHMTFANVNKEELTCASLKNVTCKDLLTESQDVLSDN